MRIIIALFCLLMPSFQTAWAFGTIHGLGQSAEHEKITRIGLASFGLGPKTLSEIAGKRGSFGAVGAPDRPDRGLLTNEAAHCDGADSHNAPGYPQSSAQAAAKLNRCRAWIMRNLSNAVRQAGAIVDERGSIRDSQIPTFISCVYNGKTGRAKCNVLEAIGLALHAAQDFYSHTNWSDQPGGSTLDNPPGLGQGRRSPWLDPRRSAPFPVGLISGCFRGIPEKAFCKGRIRHADLNKDTGRIYVATRAIGQGRTHRGKQHDNFGRAVRAAIDDTRDKWAYFEQRVLATYGKQRGSRIVCAIRRDDPSSCP